MGVLKKQAQHGQDQLNKPRAGSDEDRLDAKSIFLGYSEELKDYELYDLVGKPQSLV